MSQGPYPGSSQPYGHPGGGQPLQPYGQPGPYSQSAPFGQQPGPYGQSAGQPLGGQPSASFGPQQPYGPPQPGGVAPKKGKGLLIGLVAAVLVLATVGVVAVLYLRSDPSTVDPVATPTMATPSTSVSPTPSTRSSTRPSSRPSSSATNPGSGLKKAGQKLPDQVAGIPQVQAPTPSAGVGYSAVGIYSGQGKTFLIVMVNKPVQAEVLRNLDTSLTEKADVGGAYCGRSARATVCYRQLDGGVIGYVDQNPTGPFEEGAQALQAVYDSFA